MVKPIKLTLNRADAYTIQRALKRESDHWTSEMKKARAAGSVTSIAECAAAGADADMVLDTVNRAIEGKL